jgi:hypothetical protein
MFQATDWVIRQTDLIELRGLSTGEGAFTKIYVLFTDAETGQQCEAHAEKGVQEVGLLERVVRVADPIGCKAAQAIANEAVAVLGGPPTRRYWVTVKLTQQLSRGEGQVGQAGEINRGDTVILEHGRPERLHVFDVTRDTSEGTVLVMLGADDLGKRMDVELRLLELEGR